MKEKHNSWLIMQTLHFQIIFINSYNLLNTLVAKNTDTCHSDPWHNNYDDEFLFCQNHNILARARLYCAICNKITLQFARRHKNTWIEIEALSQWLTLAHCQVLTGIDVVYWRMSIIFILNRIILGNTCLKIGMSCLLKPVIKGHIISGASSSQCALIWRFYCNAKKVWRYFW
jgi:hypothetical protein